MKVVKAKLKNYIKTENFKIIIGVMFIYSLYNVMYLTASYSYIESVLYSYSDTFTILFIITLFLINTINIIRVFDKNEIYIIRYKTKKQYFKNLVKNIFIKNTILFIINFIILLLLILLFNNNGFVIDSIGSYEVSNLVYTGIHLLKIFILIQCFSMICCFMYKIGIRFIVWILMSIFIILHMETPIKEGFIIDEVSEISINPIDYFRVQEFSSYGFELKVTAIYLIVWILITVIIFFISSKRIKQIGE